MWMKAQLSSSLRFKQRVRLLECAFVLDDVLRKVPISLKVRERKENENGACAEVPYRHSELTENG